MTIFYMIYLSIFLHIYQPPTQEPEITKQITQDSYRLILKILNRTHGKITLNIPASLTEQLEGDVINGIIDLVQKGQIELTATGAYHPILPLLPRSIITRQIELNNQINKKYFGNLYCPNGFFPPEMAVSTELVEVLEELNYKWVILDELTYKRRLQIMDHSVIYVKRNQIINNHLNNLSLFFRDNFLSTEIAMCRIKTIDEIFNYINNNYKSCLPAGRSEQDQYFVLAMDGETFGHHQIGQDKLLIDLLCNKKAQIVTISEIGKYFRTKVETDPLQCSWGTSIDELREKNYYPKWNDPKNPIHKLQWKLLRLSNADRALHSDQFWWASHAPYWHPGMIEKGARMMRDSVAINNKKEAEKIYNEIVKLCHCEDPPNWRGYVAIPLEIASPSINSGSQ